MIVIRLITRNFGTLGTRMFEFGPGLNLVKGPNESGKSTLVDALIWGLYADPRNPPEAVKVRETWGSRGGVALSVGFTAGRHQFRIDTDFAKGTRSLTDERTDMSTDDPTVMGRLVGEALGIVSPELFTSTVCIRQNEVTDVSSGAVVLRDRLEALVTGGGEATAASSAISAVEREIAELEGHDGRGGRLADIEKKRAGYAVEAERLRLSLTGVSQTRSELGEVEEGLSILERQIVGKREKFDRSAKAWQSESQQRTLRERYAELEGRVREVRSHEKRLSDIRREISEAAVVDPEDLARADELETKLRFLDNRRVELERQVKSCREEAEARSGASPWNGVAVGSIVLAVASAAAALLLKIMPIFAGVAVFGGLSAFGFIRSKKQRGQRGRLQEKVDAAQKEYDALGEEIYQTSVASKAILRKYDVRKPTDLRDLIDSRKELERESKAVSARYEVFIGDSSPDKLEAEMRTVMQELSTVEEGLRDFRMYGLSDDERAMLKGDLDVFEGQQKELSSARETLLRKIESAEDGQEGVAAFEERVAALADEQAQVRRRLDVLKRTLQLLTESRTGIITATTSAIEQRASWQIAHITNGRYRHISFDQHSLAFKVYSAERKGWVDPQRHLSRGAVDAIYLVSRLAIIDMITRGRKPFLVFDDPIVSFDDERAGATLRLLQSMAQDVQILLLTCHDGYDPVATRVVQLMRRRVAAPDVAPPLGEDAAQHQSGIKRSIPPFEPPREAEEPGGVPGGFRL